MGTSGLIVIIFTVNGQQRKLITYNHCDSGELGMTLVRELYDLLSRYDLDILVKIFNGIAVVTNEIPPTPDQIILLKSYADLDVSNQSLDDWYCLLRKTQGSLFQIIGCGYILQSTIDTDAEYIYTIDCDSQRFLCNDKNVCALTVNSLCRMF